MNAGQAPALDISGLRFRWHAREPWLLDIPALQIARGERVFVAGPSGCGKSTLLSLIAGILPPVEGRIAVLGTVLGTLRGAARDRFRAEHLGILFQSFNLLPYLSVLDNVLLGCRFSPARTARAAADGTPADEARRLLARLGLADPALLARAATALSVGQQQRVAAARALIGRPALLVADEPTSALDADTREDFMRLLMQETTAAGSALLFVSHERGLGTSFDRSLDLRALAPASA